MVIIITMNIEMLIWIWCFGIIVSTYVETMDRKNLIRIVPSAMSYKDKDAVENKVKPSYSTHV